MIKFIEKFTELLPYNRTQYQTLENWFGISIQLDGVFEGKKIEYNYFIESYKFFFDNIITTFDINYEWIINHDFLDEEWFPNKKRNLKKLRKLFKQNNISNNFKGAVIFSSDELLKFSIDVITYPFIVLGKEGLLYNNLDISCSGTPLIIKVSGHMCIDILSTNQQILKDILKNIDLTNFILKQYRGTNIL